MASSRMDPGVVKSRVSDIVDIGMGPADIIACEVVVMPVGGCCGC